MGRVVLDTNVWLDLLLFGDPRCARLQSALAGGAVQVLTSEACRAEWQRVLSYPALRLDQDQAMRLAAAYDALASVEAAPANHRLPRCKDPDDQKFLELACAARADALLTRDRALLALAGRAHRQCQFRICLPEAW